MKVYKFVGDFSFFEGGPISFWLFCVAMISMSKKNAFESHMLWEGMVYIICTGFSLLSKFFIDVALSCASTDIY